MGQLRIRTLGGVTIEHDGEPLAGLASRKAEALLLYLACNPRTHPRETLADLLWDDRPQARALGNLRVVLSTLRQTVGAHITITRQTAAINSASVWLDAAIIEEAASAVAATGRITSPGLAEQSRFAVACYEGDFLQGYSLRDAREFEAWAAVERERLHRLAVDVLLALARWHLLMGEPQVAARTADRLLEIEPLAEAGYRQLMRAMAAAGQRSAALAQYEACRCRLQDDLGVEPGLETTRLYEQIRDRHLEAIPAPALPGNPHLDVRRPPFLQEGTADVEPPTVVARERELATLDQHLRQALDGHGNVVFVTGVAGQGKTALLHEFARRAVHMNPTLLATAGSCSFYSGAGDPYVPFREVMAMLTGDAASPWSSGTISREHAQRLWSSLPQTVPLLVQQGDALLGTFVDGPDLYQRALLAIPDHVEDLQQLRDLIVRIQSHTNPIEQTRLCEHITGFLFDLADRYPLLILLDDLQWVDSASVALLFHLGRQLAAGNHRIMIVGAYRAEEVALTRGGERHPLVKVVNELGRLFGIQGVNLERTEQCEGRRFVDTLLDTEPNQLGEAFRAALFRRTQGHPLFTVELLRTMQERGDVAKNEAGLWVAAPALDWELLPARVQAVIEERVDRVPTELQRILNIASVEGVVFTAEIVGAVLGVAPLLLHEQLAGTLGRQHRLLQDQGEAHTAQGRVSRFQFRHILFQDYVYNRLSGAERRLLHKEVALAIETVYGAQDGAMAVQLAHHYVQAGEDRPALHYSIVAARRAARLYAGEETVQHASRAIALAERLDSDRCVLIGLYRDRGLAYERSGNFQRAYGDLDRARQIAQVEKRRGCECEALIDLGKLWASKDYRQSQDYFRQALVQARALDDPIVRAASLNWMGNWHANAEEPNEAIAYHQEALQLLQESDNQLERGRTLDLLAIASLLAGDTRGSKGYFDQAIAIFRELDDRAALASSLIGRGNCGGSVFNTVPRAVRPPVARRDFEEAIQIAREIHAPAAEAWVGWSLAFLERLLGQFGKAQAVAEHGLEIATAIGHREWIVGNRVALGVLAVETFAVIEAQHHLQAALTLARELQSQYWINHITRALASLYLVQGDSAQAERTLAAVISPQTPMDTFSRRGCWARRAELALAQGDPGRAATIVDRLIQTVPNPRPDDVIPHLWLLKGKAQTALGQLEHALSLLRSAEEAARENDEYFLLWRFHAALAALYVEMNDLAAAAQERSLAEALIAELAASLCDKKRQQTYRARALNRLPVVP